MQADELALAATELLKHTSTSNAQLLCLHIHVQDMATQIQTASSDTAKSPQVGSCDMLFTLYDWTKATVWRRGHKGLRVPGETHASMQKYLLAHTPK